MSRRWYLGPLLAMTFAARIAHADEEAMTKQSCASAHERTQRLRLSGKLVEARSEALSCLRDACPSVVRTECARLLGELDVATPSMSFEVVEEGGAVRSDATIRVDGVVIDAREGKSLRLDPGPHKVRAAVADGRSVEREELLVEGEASRGVVLTIGRSRPVESALPKPSVLPPAIPPPRQGTPSWPLYVAGGTFVAALGTFIGFGMHGYTEQVSLESSCAPRCSPNRDDVMRRDYLVADIALGTSVVALAAASYLLFRRSHGE